MYRQNPGHLLNAYIFRNWDLIHLTRRYLNDIMITMFKDRNFAEKVANASSELIENAFKYSPKDSDLNVSLSDTDNSVVLEVKNYPNADSKSAHKNIKSELDKIYSEGSAKEAFKKKIIEYVNDPNGNSALGFAKIRLETDAKISTEIDEQGLIIVKASFPKK
jgi:hypothetical protein